MTSRELSVPDSGSAPVAAGPRPDGAVPVAELGLHRRLVGALGAAGQVSLPRVQALAIPPALLGRDVLALATPGLETTAAFVLPVLHRLLTHAAPVPAAHAPRALLLAPTTQAGEAIVEVVQQYGAGSGLRRQVALERLADGARPGRDFDMLIATPGGLLDLLHHGQLDLDSVEVVALSSFDRMLDPKRLAALGRVIHHLPTNRQVLLFHGGLPGYARDLASQILRNPVRVVAEEDAAGGGMAMQGVVYVANEAKQRTLRALVERPSVTRALVFTRTKHAAVAATRFVRDGSRGAETMHGDVSERTRAEVLSRFADGRSPVLVTTDMAVRDVEVGPVSHVINYDLPSDASDYVARMIRLSGGTGPGSAISLCSEPERSALGRIERLLGDPIPTLGDDFAVVDRVSLAHRRTRRASPRAPGS